MQSFRSARLSRRSWPCVVPAPASWPVSSVGLRSDYLEFIFASRRRWALSLGRCRSLAAFFGRYFLSAALGLLPLASSRSFLPRRFPFLILVRPAGRDQRLPPSCFVTKRLVQPRANLCSRNSCEGFLQENRTPARFLYQCGPHLTICPSLRACVPSPTDTRKAHCPTKPVASDEAASPLHKSTTTFTCHVLGPKIRP